MYLIFAKNDYSENTFNEQLFSQIEWLVSRPGCSNSWNYICVCLRLWRGQKVAVQLDVYTCFSVPRFFHPLAAWEFIHSTFVRDQNPPDASSTAETNNEDEDGISNVVRFKWPVWSVRNLHLKPVRDDWLLQIAVWEVIESETFVLHVTETHFVCIE